MAGEHVLVAQWRPSAQSEGSTVGTPALQPGPACGQGMHVPLTAIPTDGSKVAAPRNLLPARWQGACQERAFNTSLLHLCTSTPVPLSGSYMAGGGELTCLHASCKLHPDQRHCRSAAHQLAWLTSIFSKYCRVARAGGVEVGVKLARRSGLT